VYLYSDLESFNYLRSTASFPNSLSSLSSDLESFFQLPSFNCFVSRFLRFQTPNLSIAAAIDLDKFANRYFKHICRMEKPLPVPYLPREVWLMVFGYLDYCDLKRCKRVCQLFFGLTNRRSFHTAFFKGPVQSAGTPINLTTLKIHPALDAVLTSKCLFPSIGSD